MFSKIIWIHSWPMAIAEELQLKGLMGNTDKKIQDFEEDDKSIIMAQTFSPAINKDKTKKRPSSKIHNPGENRTLAVPNKFSGDLFELEERVKSMMEKSKNKIASGIKLAHICKVCGKEGNIKGNIKDHIEANHMEGVIIPCNVCEKTFRYKMV